MIHNKHIVGLHIVIVFILIIRCIFYCIDKLVHKISKCNKKFAHSQFSQFNWETLQIQKADELKSEWLISLLTQLQE